MTNFWQALEEFNNQTASDPKIEYRLYYKDDGSPDFYSTEDLPGKYIVIDYDTYLCGDYRNIKVKDGKILRKNPLDSTKLVQSNFEGTPCHSSDVSLVKHSTKTVKYWKLKTHEYR